MKLYHFCYTFILCLFCYSSCAVPIKDEQVCAVVPGNLGAVCDNILSSNQVILNQVQWQALQDSWNAQGQAVECFNSNALGDLKTELEELCSKTSCSVQLKTQVLEGLSRIQALENPSHR